MRDSVDEMHIEHARQIVELHSRDAAPDRLAAQGNRPSPDTLEGLISLANEIKRSDGEDSIDVDRLVEISAIAAGSPKP